MRLSIDHDAAGAEGCDLTLVLAAIGHGSRVDGVPVVRGTRGFRDFD